MDCKTRFSPALLAAPSSHGKTSITLNVTVEIAISVDSNFADKERSLNIQKFLDSSF